MLALALDQDINAISTDVSDPGALIVGRVSRDGTPITGRKRRAPVSPRDQKRGKRLQGLGDESDGDEFSSEDDGRMETNIESDNETSETLAEYQEEGAATVCGEKGGSDGDAKESGAVRERRGDAEEDGSIEDYEDIVDDRDGGEGMDLKNLGWILEPGKSGKGGVPLCTGTRKTNSRVSSRPQVQVGKKTKTTKRTRSHIRSGPLRIWGNKK